MHTLTHTKKRNKYKQHTDSFHVMGTNTLWWMGVLWRVVSLHMVTLHRFSIWAMFLFKTHCNFLHFQNIFFLFFSAAKAENRLCNYCFPRGATPRIYCPCLLVCKLGTVSNSWIHILTAFIINTEHAQRNKTITLRNSIKTTSSKGDMTDQLFFLLLQV